MVRRWGTRAAACAACALALLLGGQSVAAGARASAPPRVRLTIGTDELASRAPFMGLGVELDPYDSLTPTPAQWSLIFQRLDFMHPGFLRVVEPASDYFGGYGPGHVPAYRWTAPHVQQLLAILAYAQSRGIPVVLGDWGDPAIGGDARIPAGFIAALRAQYGFTVLEYYDPINEPNDSGPGCPFGCWSQIMSSLSQALAAAGLGGAVRLTGPDDANSWDDTAVAQAADRTSGLDSDNPLGGDSWVTLTLQSIPSLIGAYDSHRYATIWGAENGVYEDQMRARRLQVDNLDSPAKPYFAGELGLTARQVTPFWATPTAAMRRALAAMIDPGARAQVSGFVDSQPHIGELAYGAWMGDLAVQGMDAGLSGESAWDLDDAMHAGGGYGSLGLKQWGFWNLLAGQNGYPAADLAPRPWYDAWSEISRAFPSGSQILLVPSTQVPGLRVAAAKIPAGGRDRLSFAIVNDSSAPRTLTLTVPSATRPVSLARYDYFAGDDPVDANRLPIPAQMLHGVRLAAGQTVRLPSQGLIVLSSVGVGRPVPLSRGLRTLLDPLAGWRAAHTHSRRLRLDHSGPAQFDYDSSRATAVPKTRKKQFLIYRGHQISSFALDAYYRTSLGLRVYGSPDGTVWRALPLAATNPAPTVGGGEYLAQLVPGAQIPAGINRLEIVLSGRDTELGQVRIDYDRVGPACLPATLDVAGGSLAGIGLGAGRARLHWLYGAPSSESRRVWRYCVSGGGQLAVVLAGRSGASLIATSARGARAGGVGPGTSVVRLRRASRALGLRALAPGLLLVTRPPGGIMLVVRGGEVRAVAVATPELLSRPGSLLRALRQARL